MSYIEKCNWRQWWIQYLFILFYEKFSCSNWVSHSSSTLKKTWNDLHNFFLSPQTWFLCAHHPHHRQQFCSQKRELYASTCFESQHKIKFSISVSFWRLLEAWDISCAANSVTKGSWGRINICGALQAEYLFVKRKNLSTSSGLCLVVSPLLFAFN